MSRIIAGVAGSRRLMAAAAATRPTSDRVRESLFGKLAAANQISGSRVLDLFAGSGALGLEAASRGASAVTLVERNAAAIKVVRANAAMVQSAIENAGVNCEITVAPIAVAKFLQGAESGSFELIFADPPYDLSDAQLSAELENLSAAAVAGALLVVERSSRSPLAKIKGFSHLETRGFGDTALQFFERD